MVHVMLNSVLLTMQLLVHHAGQVHCSHFQGPEPIEPNVPISLHRG